MLIFPVIKRRTREFDPASLTGLALWLRADRGAYTDAGKTVPAADGAALACWADQSGNGHDAIQVTPGFRPTLHAGAVGGEPAVRFDGVDDLFEVTNPVELTAHTVFLVMRINDGAQGIVLGGKMTPAYAVYRYLDNRLYYYDGATQSSVPLPSVASFSVVESNHNGRAWRAFLNGARAGLDQVFPNAGIEIGMVGNRGNLDSPFPGSLAELIVYGYALTDADRLRVESYLRGRYRLY